MREKVAFSFFLLTINEKKSEKTLVMKEKVNEMC
jgi:hypothetical protein